MADSTRPGEPTGRGGGANLGRRGDRPPGAPRWVRVFGAFSVIAAALFVVLHLVGGGFRSHGP